MRNTIINRIKYFRLLHVLFAALVVCGMTGGMAYGQTTVLKLDINNRDIAAETEPGFTSFTIADNGSDVNGVTIQIDGTLDSRRRGAPTGIGLEQIYRDFIFSRPGGMTLTLSGLEANANYEIKIYAFDTSSAGSRIADWMSNGEIILTTTFSGGTNPTSAESHGFTGSAQSDENGRLVLECVANPNTTELSGANNPFGFINGLVLTTTAVITKARDPEPADNALYPDTGVTLSWTPGGFAASSNVYFGTSFDDVNDATPEDPNIFLGSTTGNTFELDSLERGTTYYWRVDSINDSQADSPWKGNVWSFTVQSITAFGPAPANGALFADPNGLLSWDPGAYATEHHVYFGDNLEDVQAGTGGTDKGIVTDPNYIAGPLELDKTYYWRIDEFDGTNTHTGQVWSFTTTIEGLGMAILEIWENIGGSTLNLLTDERNYPDRPDRSEELTEFSIELVETNYGARIHGWLYVPLTGDYTFWFTSADQGELWLSTDDDPTNVQLLASEPTWGQLDAFSRKSEPIPLVGGERYYIMAIWKQGGDWDHCQAAWQGPGIPHMEIIQGNYMAPYKPVAAYGPIPGDGTVELKVDPVFTWRPGTHAVSHIVNLGTDPNALSQVATTQLGDESYAPAQLDFNQTYYWRIDEVNDANPDSPWIGETWSFSTGNFIVIDDFEDYNDWEPDTIYFAWIDGFDNPATNGSTSGYPEPIFSNGEHFVETDIVHGGYQSMPYFYDNTAAPISEATLALTSNTNWTLYDLETLRLWHTADPNNTNAPEPMFVTLNDSVTVVNEDANAALATEWTEWVIDLQAFADQGLNLANVRSITIGFGDIPPGGAGLVFFDDIRLYRPDE